MGVIVKDMEKPENCLKCPMQFGGWCYVAPPEIDERVTPTVDEAWEQGIKRLVHRMGCPDQNGVPLSHSRRNTAI